MGMGRHPSYGEARKRTATRVLVSDARTCERRRCIGLRCTRSLGSGMGMGRHPSYVEARKRTATSVLVSDART
eukprot:3644061-Prymnesium_polylepis.1